MDMAVDTLLDFSMATVTVTMATVTVTVTMVLVTAVRIMVVTRAEAKVRLRCLQATPIQHKTLVHRATRACYALTQLQGLQIQLAFSRLGVT